MAKSNYPKESCWYEIQNQIIQKYPDFKSLPLFTRIKLRMTNFPNTCVETYESGTDTFKQTYKTYIHNGQEYFYKFGW